jgi:hypothetical protein
VGGWLDGWVDGSKTCFIAYNNKKYQDFGEKNKYAEQNLA